jgi:hypothetical protein
LLHAFCTTLRGSFFLFLTARFAQDLSGGMTLKASLAKRIPLDVKYAKKTFYQYRNGRFDKPLHPSGKQIDYYQQ